MAGYGVTPLGSDGLALGSVYPPNAPSGNPVPLQGGTINTDGSGNTSAPVRAELAPTQTVSGTLQSAATATGNGATLAVMGYASCVFTVTGTFVGTITFTGISQDGVTTTPLNCAKRGAGAMSTTATTTGLYECNIPGLSAVEAVITAYTSGSITVTATALPVPLAVTTVRIDANQPAIPISGSVTASNPSVGTDGSAIPTSSTLLGASDGTNLQPLQVDASKYLKVNIAAGSLTASNASVGTDGSAIPTSSTLIGASDGTNLQPLQVDASHYLKVNVAAGSLSASNPSVGTDGSAIPTSSTLIGASDGTNLQQLLVESSSNKNLRVGLYSGANEATVTGSNALKVDGSSVTQPVSGTLTTHPGTATSGGSTPYHLISAATTNATSLKASAGQVYGLSISNTNASARYFKLFNKASAPTIGTDTPIMTVQVPGNGTVIRVFPVGLALGTGIAFAATGALADLDTTTIGAGDLSIDLDYA